MFTRTRSRRLLTVGVAAAGALAVSIGPALADYGPGSSGAGVKCVQRGVNFFESPVLSVDGQYGPLTTEAVQDFQSEFGLSPDGIVGPLTGSKLISEVEHLVYVIIHTGGSPAVEDAWLSQCSSLMP
jgi:peptidoglycan hydrolase-like protein with peptidoglycan-binding domain